MENNEEVLKRLDAIIALLATQGQEEKTRSDILRGLHFTYEEISSLTGVPLGTLKSREHRKRKR